MLIYGHWKSLRQKNNLIMICMYSYWYKKGSFMQKGMHDIPEIPGQEKTVFFHLAVETFHLLLITFKVIWQMSVHFANYFKN